MKVPALLRLLLWPLSVVYGAGARIRAGAYARGWRKQRRLRGKVVSVGNLTVGGTGKTPMVIWLAERFLAHGKRVAILSRGYRGSSGTSDEIEVMRKRLGDRVLFGVGKNRFAEGSKMEAKQAVDVFLLDDGFQHLSLARDVDILLMDALRPVHRAVLLPVGSLREPVSAMGRADLLVLTRVEERSAGEDGFAGMSGYPVFTAASRLLGFRKREENELRPLTAIGPGPFFAFCGVGNPGAFLRDLEIWGVPVAGKRVFGDHHRYSEADVKTLEKEARAAGAIVFVTTAKDAENLGDLTFAQMPVYIAEIALKVRQEEEFWSAINARIEGRLEGKMETRA